MRHLVDLQDKIAIITWWNPTFGTTINQDLHRYRHLIGRREWVGDELTAEEKEELQTLAQSVIQVPIVIDTVGIVDALCVDLTQIKNTYTLTGQQYEQITHAIRGLRKEHNLQGTIEAVCENLSDNDCD